MSAPTLEQTELGLVCSHCGDRVESGSHVQTHTYQDCAEALLEKVDSLQTRLEASEAEVLLLRTQRDFAKSLAYECFDYVPDYFREKHGYDKEIEQLSRPEWLKLGPT